MKLAYDLGATSLRRVGGGDPLWNGLTHYWALDETSGNLANEVDESFYLSRANGLTSQAGKNGNCIKTDRASSRYARRPVNEYAFVPTSYAISFWAKPQTGMTTYPHVLGNAITGGGAGQFWFQAMYVNGTTWKLSWQDFTEGLVRNTSENCLFTDQWTHIVAAGGGAYLARKIYINGTLSSLLNPYSVSAYTKAAGFMLGCVDITTANTFTGLIDEVGIWTGRDLTQDDATALYASGSGKFY